MDPRFTRPALLRSPARSAWNAVRTPGSSDACERLPDGLEQPASVGSPQLRVYHALRMRHQPRHVPSIVDDARDVPERPVRVSGSGHRARWLDVPEDDAAFGFE